jgi:hypothetical protein
MAGNVAVNCGETVVKKDTVQVRCQRISKSFESQEHTGRHEHTRRGQEQYEHVDHRSTEMFVSSNPKQNTRCYTVIPEKQTAIRWHNEQDMEELTLFANLCQIAIG